MAALGAAMLATDAADVVATELTDEAFTREGHRRVFRSVARLRGAGKASDVVTVAADLAAHGDLADDGNDPQRPSRLHLFELTQACPSPAAAAAYVEILAGLARRRRLIVVTHGAAEKLSGDGVDTDEALGAVLEAVREVPPSQEDPIDGADYLIGLDEYAAIWGSGDEVLWAAEEPAMVAAPPGLGKTRFALSLALAMLGIRKSELLGFPVAEADRPVLYLALDRPKQAGKLLRRMLEADGIETEAVRHLLQWKPHRLPFDIAREPEKLVAYAERAGAGTVVIDSLGNAARELSKDETGSGIHAATSGLVAAGLEVLVLHHSRKASADNRTPHTIDDIYGSQWIYAAMGSCLFLRGKPGDPVVKVLHLKQPVEDVGPITVAWDARALRFDPQEQRDVVGILRSTPLGLSARQIARQLYDTSDPTDSDVRRVDSKLRRRMDSGLVHKRKENGSALWFATVDGHGQGRLG